MDLHRGPEVERRGQAVALRGTAAQEDPASVARATATAARLAATAARAPLAATALPVDRARPEPLVARAVRVRSLRDMSSAAQSPTARSRAEDGAATPTWIRAAPVRPRARRVILCRPPPLGRTTSKRRSHATARATARPARSAATRPCTLDRRPPAWRPRPASTHHLRRRAGTPPAVARSATPSKSCPPSACREPVKRRRRSAKICLRISISACR